MGRSHRASPALAAMQGSRFLAGPQAAGSGMRAARFSDNVRTTPDGLVRAKTSRCPGRQDGSILPRPGKGQGPDNLSDGHRPSWIPAFAGMTGRSWQRELARLAPWHLGVKLQPSPPAPHCGSRPDRSEVAPWIMHRDPGIPARNKKRLHGAAGRSAPQHPPVIPVRAGTHRDRRTPSPQVPACTGLNKVEFVGVGICRRNSKEMRNQIVAHARCRLFHFVQQ